MESSLANGASLDAQRQHIAIDSKVLNEINVLIITTGHNATDHRIYAKQARSLQKLGARVTVIGKLEHDEPAEVPILAVASPRSRVTRFLVQPWRCFWKARHLDADIIHFHDPEVLLALPFAKLWWFRSKFIYDVHEDFANLIMIRDWLPARIKPAIRASIEWVEKRLAAAVDGIVCVTLPLAARFRHKYKSVACNFVTQEFFAQAGDIKAQMRIYDLVHIGTLTRQRALFLAETLRDFHRLRPGTRSLIIGVTRETEKLMGKLPKESCVLARVTHAEVPGLLGHCKIGLDVHPWESPHLEVAVPVKVCEYMAAGCAVVSSSMPALRDLLQTAHVSAEYLTLIKRGAPADYAEAAARMLERIEKGDDPGAKLRQTAAKYMNWNGEAQKIANLYLQVLERQCAT